MTSLQLSRKGKLLFAASGVLAALNLVAAVLFNMVDQTTRRGKPLAAARAIKVLFRLVELNGRTVSPGRSKSELTSGSWSSNLPLYDGEPQLAGCGTTAYTPNSDSAGCPDPVVLASALPRQLG
jgi:hypothetical protein